MYSSGNLTGCIKVFNICRTVNTDIKSAVLIMKCRINKNRFFADIILGYRVGARLLYADTLQYHPTGTGYPEQIFGALVTEKVRSLGAKLVNIDGEVFMHPLETRDVTAASIIRECTEREVGKP